MQLLSKRGDYSDAKAMLDESLRLDTDPIAQGEANFRLGVCTYRMGDESEAERLLRLSRDELKVGHPLDAEAAYLLGKIRQEQNDPKEAISFYHAVLTSHPESDVAVLARLGRGQCRIVLGDDAAGLTDMHDLVGELGEASHRKHLAEVKAGLKQSAAILAAQEKYQARWNCWPTSNRSRRARPRGIFIRGWRSCTRSALTRSSGRCPSRPTRPGVKSAARTRLASATMPATRTSALRR